MSLQALRSRIGEISDLLCSLNLLVWDSRVTMPPGGTTPRGHQIATLTRLARDMLAAGETLELLGQAEREAAQVPPDNLVHEELRQIRRGAELHRRIPGELIARRAAVRAGANAAWVQARATSDFALFSPWLEETVKNSREYADALGWRAHRYDALVGLYEPGETLASLQSLFAKLKSGIAPILDSALGRARADTGFVQNQYPVDLQRQVAARFAKRLGYDFARGRLDATVHPFEISFTREDARITTRFNPRDLRPALFGTFHEAGHGMYEQNIDPAFSRSVFACDLAGLYAAGGASFGAHESQSRLWENHVGRSPRFWDLHFGDLLDAFPEALAGVTAAAFRQSVVDVRRSLIRTDADELTYDLHVMLRVEIEAVLIDGSLKVADVPAAWGDAMQRHLGLSVPGDREGALQDIHWSSGMIGSFCTYTIGNVMAAQLFAVARQSPGVADGLRDGDYAPLAGWLREHVWRHGRSRSREALLQQATGSGLDPAAYLLHLSQRYGASSGGEHGAI